MNSSQNDNIIYSENLNQNTNFPYLVLDVIGENAYPRNPGFHVMHWHEDLQFIYVIDGLIYIKTLEEEVSLTTGEGIFINKNVIHIVRQSDSCHYNSFIFPDYFLSFYEGSPMFNQTSAVVNDKTVRLIVFYKEEWCHNILTLLSELVSLKKKPDVFYEYEVTVKLSEIWLALLKHLSNQTPGSKPDDKTSIRTAIMLRFIETHYSKKITLEELATSANISKSECLRCFQATLHTTPFTYLLDFRISKAIELLKNTPNTISEVAEKTGFHSQSYFGKCFKERMNCSAIEYRKNYFYD